MKCPRCHVEVPTEALRCPDCKLPKPKSLIAQSGKDKTKSKLATKRTPWPAAPGRVYRAPWSLVADADPGGGDVTVSFA